MNIFKTNENRIFREINKDITNIYNAINEFYGEYYVYTQPNKDNLRSICGKIKDSLNLINRKITKNEDLFLDKSSSEFKDGVMVNFSYVFLNFKNLQEHLYRNANRYRAVVIKSELDEIEVNMNDLKTKMDRLLLGQSITKSNKLEEMEK